MGDAGRTPSPLAVEAASVLRAYGEAIQRRMVAGRSTSRSQEAEMSGQRHDEVLDTDGYLADAVQREEDRQQDKAEQVAEGRLRRFIGAYFVTCCLVTLGCALLGIDTYLLDGTVLGGQP